jgi:hypothetical protein
MSAPTVILSYGLGVDSTAILLRWINEPTSRDFDLDQLAVVTAMTGDEWDQSGVDVETHLLPLLREHGIRFVQAARAQRLVTVSGEGVVILDDSRHPEKLHLSGAFKLSDEMRQAGTIPQTGGARLCSVHAKGDVLDPIIATLTEGNPYRHVIGFEANEPKRATKDATYNTATRTGVYPLIEWNWDRAACEAYITQVTGATWEKSACTFCPFALANKAGRARTLARYAETPAAGVETLMLEHIALTLNPAQGLIGGTRAIDVVREAGYTHVIDAFQEALEASESALYEVRRILRPHKADPTRMANAARSVRRVANGTRAAMLDLLEGTAGDVLETGADGIARAYLRRRGATFPTAEHFLVVGPSDVADKESKHFDQWWADLPDAGAEPVTEPDQLALFA